MPASRNGTRLRQLLTPGALSTRYQPIFKVRNGHRALFALEALTRGPRGTPLEDAESLFAFVRSEGGESAVDRVCITGAVRGARVTPPDVSLSLNVHATTLSEPDFIDFLLTLCREADVAPCRVILEIGEHDPPGTGGALLRAVERLRREGVGLALDDVDRGAANLERIVDLHPEFLKLGRQLVCGADRDPYRRAVVKSVSMLAPMIGARVVAEGVEEKVELATVMELGIDLVQGYLLSSPLAAWPEWGVAGGEGS